MVISHAFRACGGDTPSLLRDLDSARSAARCLSGYCRVARDDCPLRVSVRASFDASIRTSNDRDQQPERERKMSSHKQGLMSEISAEDARWKPADDQGDERPSVEGTR